MNNFNYKSSTGPESITRNLEDGAGYSPDWAWQLVDAYITEIALAENESAALDEILKEEENNSIVAQALLFHFGRECKLETSIQYAISCLKTGATSHTGSQIAAMVIAGRTVEQIAHDIRCKPEHVAVYEDLFFDVRRYRECTPWLKNLCYRYQGPKSSEPYLSRWLITAFERDWEGLSAIISKPSQPKSSLPADHRLREFELGLMARGSDYINSLEMMGVPPNEADLQWLSKFLMSEVARTRGFGTSSYPRPETAAPENKTEAPETLATAEQMLNLLKRFTVTPPPPKSDFTWGA